MSDESEIIAESVGAVVSALSEQSRALAPLKAAAEYVSRRLGIHYAPKLTERAIAAAEKIKQSGLPERAYSEIGDPLVCAILEASAIEDDSDLQKVWENLLANAMTDESSEVRRAFPEILSQLDPKDVRLLDELSRQTSDERYLVHQFASVPGKRDGVSLDNLTALELLRPVREVPTTTGSIAIDDSSIRGYAFTARGWAFVKACQPPQRAG